MQTRLNLLSDPYDDVAPPAREYFTKTRDKLNAEVKQRGEQRADLKKRIEELRRNKQCSDNRDALVTAYLKSEQEQIKINADLERQIKDLTERIKQCKDQMEQRQKLLEK